MFTPSHHTHPSEIFAIRFFLGIFESAMLPGVVFYLSTFYKRNELASRVGLFYGKPLSSSINWSKTNAFRIPSCIVDFGRLFRSATLARVLWSRKQINLIVTIGLIAYGVFQIHNPRHYGWQYLFWIEGERQKRILVPANSMKWLSRIVQAPVLYHLQSSRYCGCRNLRPPGSISASVKRPWHEPGFWPTPL